MSITLDKMRLTEDEFRAVEADFTNHYLLEGCGEDFEGRDIRIPFAGLYNSISVFKAANGLTDNQVGLRFVYCFDIEANSLYLRVQLFKLDLRDVTGSIGEAYNILAPFAWFEIKESSFTPTDNHNLYDNDYLDNFYYTEEGPCTGGDQLSSDLGEEKYARTVTFPWGLELLPLYQDNGGTRVNTDEYDIHFVAISYHAGSDGEAGVLYPHSIAMYLSLTDGTVLLDNTTYTDKPFKNKAADMGALCPPRCTAYTLVKRI